MESDLEFIRVLAAREKSKAQWRLRCATDALRRDLGLPTKAQQDAETLRKAWESLKAGILKLKMPPSIHAKAVAEARRIEARTLRHTAEFRS